MPLYRIMMKPVDGYPAECWAECAHERDIAPMIAEMREEFGNPNEPARVLRYEGFANEKETVFLIDDPAGQFTKDEAFGPHYEFDQQEHGAVMPDQVRTENGTCTQCGRKGPIARVRLQGMGQDKEVRPCRECLWDLASGTQVVPIEAFVETTGGGLGRLLWQDQRPVVKIIPPDSRQQEVEALARELVKMGNDDPNLTNEHYDGFLGGRQIDRTREIGQRLFELGGHKLMLMVFETVKPHLKSFAGPKHLEYAWNGIGDWRS